MKKMKRVASRLSYSEVRERQDEKDRADHGELPIAQKPEVGPQEMQVGPDVPETAELPKPGGESDATSAGPAEPVPTLPHHGPTVPVGGTAIETSKEEEQKIENAAEVAKQPVTDPHGNGSQAPEAPPQTAFKTTSSLTKPSKTVNLNGYVARPAYGVSRVFDTVAESYGDKAAISYLVDSAMKAVPESRDASGAFPTETEPRYSALPKKATFKRTLDRSLYDTLRQDIDPLGIKKPGTISRIILQEAVNRFIAAEKAPTK